MPSASPSSRCSARHSSHSALARAGAHRPELAGGGLIGLWVPSALGWVSAAVLLSGLLPLCSRADAALLWAGLLYPLAAWPAFYLAGRAGVRLSGSYPALQGAVILGLALLGAGPCLL